MNSANVNPAPVKGAPNPYLDKVINRFNEASTELRKAAESLHGRGSISDSGIEYVRVLAEAVSRSMSVCASIAKFFPEELQADGGLGTDPGAPVSSGLRELHIGRSINAALASDGARS